MEVWFYTKANCPLCDQAEQILTMLKHDGVITWIYRRDIEKNERLLEEYQLRIPVAALNDGSVLAEGAVSYGEIAALLSS